MDLKCERPMKTQNHHIPVFPITDTFPFIRGCKSYQLPPISGHFHSKKSKDKGFINPFTAGAYENGGNYPNA